MQLIVASATGVRAGEFHALRWRHVDLVRGELKIETRVDAHGEEDVTKTAAGMREVPLGANGVAALKAWKLRTKYGEPNQLVFPNRRGGYHNDMVKRKFLKLFDKLAELHAAEPEKHPTSCSLEHVLSGDRRSPSLHLAANNCFLQNQRLRDIGTFRGLARHRHHAPIPREHLR